MHNKVNEISIFTMRAMSKYTLILTNLPFPPHCVLVHSTHHILFIVKQPKVNFKDRRKQSLDLKWDALIPQLLHSFPFASFRCQFYVTRASHDNVSQWRWWKGNVEFWMKQRREKINFLIEKRVKISFSNKHKKIVKLSNDTYFLRP